MAGPLFSVGLHEVVECSARESGLEISVRWTLHSPESCVIIRIASSHVRGQELFSAVP